MVQSGGYTHTDSNEYMAVGVLAGGDVLIAVSILVVLGIHI